MQIGLVTPKLLPCRRSSLNIVKPVLKGEDGHEEKIYRRADCGDFKRRGSRVLVKQKCLKKNISDVTFYT